MFRFLIPIEQSELSQRGLLYYLLGVTISKNKALSSGVNPFAIYCSKKENTKSMNTPQRYHPIMVVLHWLTVILILGAGFLVSDEGGGRSPIDIHMILGALLLVTMIIRLTVRFIVKRPAWANTGNQFLNRLGELVHLSLYFFAFLILIFGGLIASQRNLIGYVIGTGSVVRGGLGAIGAIHHLGWFAIVLLLFLHIGGALYHQFIIKDNLMNRMWFGKE